MLLCLQDSVIASYEESAEKNYKLYQESEHCDKQAREYDHTFANINDINEKTINNILDNKPSESHILTDEEDTELPERDLKLTDGGNSPKHIADLPSNISSVIPATKTSESLASALPENSKTGNCTLSYSVLKF